MPCEIMLCTKILNIQNDTVTKHITILSISSYVLAVFLYGMKKGGGMFFKHASIYVHRKDGDN